MSLSELIETLQHYLRYAPEAHQDGVLIKEEGKVGLHEIIDMDFDENVHGTPIFVIRVT